MSNKFFILFKFRRQYWLTFEFAKCLPGTKSSILKSKRRKITQVIILMKKEILLNICFLFQLVRWQLWLCGFWHFSGLSTRWTSLKRRGSCLQHQGIHQILGKKTNQKYVEPHSTCCNFCRFKFKFVKALAISEGSCQVFNTMMVANFSQP